jgi:hypothetical protein
MIFKNKKSSELYIVHCNAIDKTNNKDSYVYVYSTLGNPDIKYVRDADEFLEKFEAVNVEL